MSEPRTPDLAGVGTTFSSTETPHKSFDKSVVSGSQSPGLTNVFSSIRPGAAAGSTTSALPNRIPETGSTAVGALATTEIGPGPTRHPKPLTAAEMFAQLEKEQEAVVNRLTRELSLLRAAHNSSVVSNNSSTSASVLPDSADHSATHFISGASHPSPSFLRRHRSSSAASNVSNAAVVQAPILPYATADYARGAVLPRQESSPGVSKSGSGNTGRNRHDSVSRISIQGQNQSGTSSPIPVPKYSGSYYSLHSGDSWSNNHQSHPSIPASLRYTGSRGTNTLNAGIDREVMLSSRFEEMSTKCEELESLKRENEALRLRVKELEDLLKLRRRESTTSENKDQDITTEADTGSLSDRTEEHSGGVRLVESMGVETNTPKP